SEINETPDRLLRQENDLRREFSRGPCGSYRVVFVGLCALEVTASDQPGGEEVAPILLVDRGRVYGRECGSVVTLERRAPPVHAVLVVGLALDDEEEGREARRVVFSEGGVAFGGVVVSLGARRDRAILHVRRVGLRRADGN